MGTKQLFAGIALSAFVLTGTVAAQTTTETKTSTETGTNDAGVPTKTTTVKHVTKHKTRQPKKILGVKVGHKTRKHEVVKKTTVDANGNKSTETKVESK